jgi:hypothetical protein
MNSSQAFAFQPATKAAAKLRAALFGPSGSGKTYSALAIASGLGARVAVIDTEHGSASKYADRFAFDVLDLADPRIDNYTAAIQAAGAAGNDVLISDSLSHPWQEQLEEIDRITTSSRHKGNKWSAWSEGTPKQKALVSAILSYPGHVIATMRSKTEWAVDQGNGKSKPVRLGLAPEQGKGIEYEFDLLLEINQAHAAECIKDRTGRFQDRVIDKPGAAFGRELALWLTDGEPPSAGPPGAQRPGRRAADPTAAPSGAPQPARHSEASDTGGGSARPLRISEAQHRRLEARLHELGLERERVKAWLAKQGAPGHFPELSPAQYNDLDRRLDGWAAQQRPPADREPAAEY